MAESEDDHGNAMSEDEAGATLGKTSRNADSRPTAFGQARPQNGATRERWEDIQRSWDQVTEGADGSLAGAVEGLREAGKRKRLLRDTTPLQRGIIRHVTVIIDLSSAMAEKDYRPSRALMVLRTTIDFIRTFFEQNPISQVAVITTHSGLAHMITNMSGNPAAHATALTEIITNLSTKQPPSGSPSLQNSLELGRASLAAAPSHGTKEIIILYGALQTADPGDIHATIRSLVSERVRVCVVGLAARMAILTDLVVRTNSLPSAASAAASSDIMYGVALHETHFRTLLMAHTTPPATSTAEQKQRAPSLLPMGFPSRVDETGEAPSLCVCHHRPSRGGYLCTRCQAKVCGLPVQCPTCALQLVQSTHLARSYHHLWPLQNYREVSWDGVRQRRRKRKEKEDRKEKARAKVQAKEDVRVNGKEKVRVEESEEDVVEDDESGDDDGGEVEVLDVCFGCLTPFPAIPKTSHEDNAYHDPKTNGTTIDSKTRRLSSRPGTSAPTISGKNKTADRVRATVTGASESSRYECKNCKQWYCIECDIFAHEVVHNCPGCNSGEVGEVEDEDVADVDEGVDEDRKGQEDNDGDAEIQGIEPRI